MAGSEFIDWQNGVFPTAPDASPKTNEPLQYLSRSRALRDTFDTISLTSSKRVKSVILGAKAVLDLV